MTIRWYDSGDTMGLMLLAKDEWKQPIMEVVSSLSKRKTDEVEKCLVAQYNGSIIGFVYAFLLPNGTLIPELIYVALGYRKNGTGAALLTAMERKSGCSTSMVFYNKSLRVYYKRQGYHVGESLEVAMKEIE